MEIGPDSPVYGISVAGELTGVDAQMLRAYEARGLLEPFRTAGGTRRYSNEDLATVNRISDLIGDGLNLAGIEQVFALEAENRRLRAQIEQLREPLPAAASVAEAAGTRPRRSRPRPNR